MKYKEWREFYITDYFTPQRGREGNMTGLSFGDIPLISAKKTDNGLKAFVTVPAERLHPCHVITLNNDGDGGAGLAYYQPFSFALDTHVTSLRSSVQLSKRVLIFISSAISKQGEKFGHGHAISNSRLMKMKLLLPVNGKGGPDFAYMEDYVREREQLQISEYVFYAKKILNEIGNVESVLALKEKEWKPFVLSAIFKLETGKGKGLNHLTQTTGGVSYLGATNRNNGVLCYVEPNNKMLQRGNGIAFIRNGEGSIGYSVYKAEPFIASSDLTIGYSDKLNRYTGLFITTIADSVRGKYNFNYKRSEKRLSKEFQNLPINEHGEPDWVYMEQYVRAITQRQIKAYLARVEKKDFNFAKNHTSTQPRNSVR